LRDEGTEGKDYGVALALVVLVLMLVAMPVGAAQ
jgi:hypothetical protein